MSAQADAAGGKQSRRMSLVEAIANVAVGYALAVLTQMLVFPMFGLQASLTENLAIGLAFTGISLTRSYVLRRLFEAPCGFSEVTARPWRFFSAAAKNPRMVW